MVKVMVARQVRRRSAGADRAQRGHAGRAGVVDAGGRRSPARRRRGRAGRRARAACVARRAATGCSRKRSPAAGAGAADVDAEAVDHVAAGDAARQAVGQARQLLAAGAPRGVGDAARSRWPAAASASVDAQAARWPTKSPPLPSTRVASPPAAPRRADGEASARRCPAGWPQVQAERLLVVDAAGDRRGHLAEQVARIDQVVVLEAQQRRRSSRRPIMPSGSRRVDAAVATCRAATRDGSNGVGAPPISVVRLRCPAPGAGRRR